MILLGKLAFTRTLFGAVFDRMRRESQESVKLSRPSSRANQFSSSFATLDMLYAASAFISA
jgi:hypothetical protein